MPIFCQKRQFCQNYTILLAKKVNRFSNFASKIEKSPAVMHMIGQKNVNSVKTHSILGQKSQYDALFPISYKKTLLLCP